jgi:ankyrin repeat protein
VTVGMVFDGVREFLSQNRPADAEVLIASHPNGFSASDYSGNLLHYAVESNRVDIVLWLLEHAVDVHAPDGRGLTPLMFACERGFDAIAKVIFYHDPSQLNERCVGCAPFNKGRTPIMFVPWSGNVELARFLLDRGADVNARNVEGTTVLMIAASMGRIELLEFFCLEARFWIFVMRRVRMLYVMQRKLMIRGPAADIFPRTS